MHAFYLVINQMYIPFNLSHNMSYAFISIQKADLNYFCVSLNLTYDLSDCPATFPH